MNAPAPTLIELQHAMRRSIVGCDDDAGAAAWIVGEGIDPKARIGIYRNTVASVLTNALRLTFPAVYRLVAAECFEGAARLFIEEDPPQRANLDDYGVGFPAFLARFEPVAGLTYLPDVARLEWAVSRALHAPDSKALDIASIAALPEGEQACVRFEHHPAAGLVRTDYAADSIWRAVLAQDDAALAALDPASGPRWLLVHRTQTGIEVNRLSYEAWRFAQALFAGHPLHAALEEAPCADAATLLAEHLAAGRLVEFSLADSTDS